MILAFVQNAITLFLNAFKLFPLMAAIVTFRRLFRDGIVDRRISYVSMVMNSSEVVEEIKIKWPRFKKAKNRKSETIDINSAIEFATDDFMSIDSLEKNDSKVKCSFAEVNAMGCAWKYLNNDNGEVLSPCYRFLANIILENGDKSNQFIEVPRLKKYIENGR